MITSAGTPDPTAAMIRGATPKVSLPWGRSVPPTGIRVGEKQMMPVASPLSAISHVRTRLPHVGPASR
jgi:hypothetical protein